MIFVGNFHWENLESFEIFRWVHTDPLAFGGPRPVYTLRYLELLDFVDFCRFFWWGEEVLERNKNLKFQRLGGFMLVMFLLV